MYCTVINQIIVLILKKIGFILEGAGTSNMQSSTSGDTDMAKTQNAACWMTEWKMKHYCYIYVQQSKIKQSEHISIVIR